ncbi:MAG: hypothetical protein IJD06_09825, partial [Clostridia bacterium]|nr:hypothetical protein [Clostridia bacterium]
MKEAVYSVLSQTLIARDTYRLTMAGDVSAITSPGQFVQIQLDSFFLRRPISVCLRDEDTLTLVYKVVGGGTKALAELPAGAKLDLLTGLGNGFDTSKSGQTPLLVGGGVGAAPLLWLCRTLVEEGKKPAVLLGFNTAEEVFLEEDFTWEEAMMRCKGKFYMQDALDQMQRDLNYISKMPIFAAIGYI